MKIAICLFAMVVVCAGKPQQRFQEDPPQPNKYEHMVGGQQLVESFLHRRLAEYINAEVVLGTITDLGVAMEWLTSTFLYIRARKNPRFYGLPQGLTPGQLDKKLLDMCQIEVNKLSSAGMLTIDQNILISPTLTGSLMARYCIALPTMKLFTKVTGKEGLQQLLNLITKCHEFSDIRLRSNDKKTLNLLNKCRNKQTIRFTLNGRIKTLDMKINCIIQAVLGCLEILESSLLVEAQRIMRIGERLLSCLLEYLEPRVNCFSALLNTIILAKCFHARIWEDSRYVSRQLVGIGVTLSNLLVAAGKTSFEEILNSNPRDIERILNRKTPTGNKIHDEISRLPKYSLSVKETTLENSKVGVEVCISLDNVAAFGKEITVNPESIMHFLLGDDDNHVVLYEKYTHAYMLGHPNVCKIVEVDSNARREIFVHFISQDWVGIDAKTSIVLFDSAEECERDYFLEKQPHSRKALDERIAVDNISDKKQPEKSTSKRKPEQEKVNKASKMGNSAKPKSAYMQQFLDTYFKKEKPNIARNKKVNHQIGTASKIKKNESEVTTKNVDKQYTPRYENKITEEEKPVEERPKESLCDGTDDNENFTKATNLENIINQSNKTYFKNANRKILIDISKEENVNTEPSDKSNKENQQIDLNVKSNIFEIGPITKSNINKENQPIGLNVTTNNVDITAKYGFKTRFPKYDLKATKEAVKEKNKERQALQAFTFESSLLECDEPPTIKQFAHTPKKKLTDCTTKENADAPDSKKMKLSENCTKSITWRSPLVQSEFLKYSPNIDVSNPEGENIRESNLNTSVMSKSSESDHNKSNPKQARPTLRNKRHNVSLADKYWCDDGEKKTSKIEENNRINICDILSTSLLDSLDIKPKETIDIDKSGDSTNFFGNFMAEKAKQPRQLNALHTSYLQYYSHLIPQATQCKDKTGFNNYGVKPSAGRKDLGQIDQADSRVQSPRIELDQVESIYENRNELQDASRSESRSTNRYVSVNQSDSRTKRSYVNTNGPTKADLYRDFQKNLEDSQNMDHSASPNRNKHYKRNYVDVNESSATLDYFDVNHEDLDRKIVKSFQDSADLIHINDDVLSFESEKGRFNYFNTRHADDPENYSQSVCVQSVDQNGYLYDPVKIDNCISDEIYDERSNFHRHNSSTNDDIDRFNKRPVPTDLLIKLTNKVPNTVNNQWMKASNLDYLNNVEMDNTIGKRTFQRKYSWEDEFLDNEPELPTEFSRNHVIREQGNVTKDSGRYQEGNVTTFAPNDEVLFRNIRISPNDAKIIGESNSNENWNDGDDMNERNVRLQNSQMGRCWNTENERDEIKRMRRNNTQSLQPEYIYERNSKHNRCNKLGDFLECRDDRYSNDSERFQPDVYEYKNRKDPKSERYTSCDVEDKRKIAITTRRGNCIRNAFDESNIANEVESGLRNRKENVINKSNYSSDLPQTIKSMVEQNQRVDTLRTNYGVAIIDGNVQQREGKRTSFVGNNAMFSNTGNNRYDNFYTTQGMFEDSQAEDVNLDFSNEHVNSEQTPKYNPHIRSKSTNFDFEVNQNRNDSFLPIYGNDYSKNKRNLTVAERIDNVRTNRDVCMTGRNYSHRQGSSIRENGGFGNETSNRFNKFRSNRDVFEKLHEGKVGWCESNSYVRNDSKVSPVRRGRRPSNLTEENRIVDTFKINERVEPSLYDCRNRMIYDAGYNQRFTNVGFDGSNFLKNGDLRDLRHNRLESIDTYQQIYNDGYNQKAPRRTLGLSNKSIRRKNDEEMIKRLKPDGQRFEQTQSYKSENAYGDDSYSSDGKFRNRCDAQRLCDFSNTKNQSVNYTKSMSFENLDVNAMRFRRERLDNHTLMKSRDVKRDFSNEFVTGNDLRYKTFSGNVRRGNDFYQFRSAPNIDETSNRCFLMNKFVQSHNRMEHDNSGDGHNQLNWNHTITSKDVSYFRNM